MKHDTQETRPDGNDVSPVPWYRHFYVWFLIAFPVMAVIAGTITLVLAVRTWDGLVVDDYYKQGLEINRTFARDQAATAKNLNAELLVNQDEWRIRILLRGNENFTEPGQISVSFIHATRSGRDQELVLDATGGGVYEGRMPEMKPGIWNVQIEAQDWRLLQRWDNT